MTEKRIAVILSHHRSGSHLLGWYIGSHPDVCYIDELTRHIKTSRLGRLETQDDVRDLILRAARHDDSPVVVVDFKYRMLDLCPSALLFMDQCPRVIHLYREDEDAFYYAWCHAQVRKREKTAEYADGVERTEVEEPPLPPRIWRDEALKRKLVSVVQEQRARYAPFATLELTYEQITGGGQEVETLPRDVDKQICDLLGVPLKPMRAQTRKMSPSDYDVYLME